MKVSLVASASAVLVLAACVVAQNGRFDAGYDATILLQIRSKASPQNAPSNVICPSGVQGRLANHASSTRALSTSVILDDCLRD